MAGKCPSCKNSTSRVVVSALTGGGGSENYLCIGYLCPHCRTILGVQMDPIAVKTDIVNEVVKALRKP